MARDVGVEGLDPHSCGGAHVGVVLDDELRLDVVVAVHLHDSGDALDFQAVGLSVQEHHQLMRGSGVEPEVDPRGVAASGLDAGVPHLVRRVIDCAVAHDSNYLSCCLIGLSYSSVFDTKSQLVIDYIFKIYIIYARYGGSRTSTNTGRGRQPLF